MTTQLGKITKKADGYEVQFERILEHDIQKVWDAITRPDKLKYWFTDIELEPRPGSQMTIRFRDADQTMSYGEVVSVEPPHKFVWTWEGELAVWELKELGPKRCKLTLVYSKLDPQFAVNAPAGLHSLLDRLEDMLAGSTVMHAFGTEGNDPDHLSLQERYRAAVFPDYPELEKYRPDGRE